MKYLTVNGLTPSVGVSPATDVFDRTREAILSGDVHEAVAKLRISLGDLRVRLSRDEWRGLGEHARRHPLHRLLLESPFTRRAFEKPRGYAGDAVLMDWIYGLVPAGDDLSPLGGMLYGYEFDSPCFKSVRTRRAVLAREIDSVAASVNDPRVLSVASGHLREIEWSQAARSGSAAITALDGDRDSLECVDRQYGCYRVCTLPATVGDLVHRRVRLAEFDLVYAAGLYDYLEDGLARVLTATLFCMLRPGGRLLIGNFTPATHDAAFMETFMDWNLVYRTPEKFRTVGRSIAPSEIAAIDQFSDENQHVTYLRVVRS